MNNPKGKPRKDIVTGCVHIMNWIGPAGQKWRACSYCDAIQPTGDLEESDLNFCYNCGETFDHMDDDPKEE